MQRAVIFFLLSTFFIGCDQGTKLLATQQLRGRAPISFLGDTFRLQYAENTGSFLGLGADLPSEVRFVVFTALMAIFLVGIAIYMFKNRRLTMAQFVALSLVVAGGAGNLIDRAFGGGRVVDFMNIGIDRVRTGIFNVADIAIMAGAILILLIPARPRRSPPDHPAPTS